MKIEQSPLKELQGATHPVLAEAVTQFQSLAYKELLPSGGPVRTQIVGKIDPAKEQQAQRVKDYMNYQIMDQMKEYEPEFDSMLFHLPLAGSTFKKFITTIFYNEAFLNSFQPMMWLCLTRLLHLRMQNLLRMLLKFQKTM